MMTDNPQTFPSFHVLYVYLKSAMVGVFHHPNAEACEAKRKELHELGQGYTFNIVEYFEGKEPKS